MAFRVFFLWKNLGPYHVARMNALAAHAEIDLSVIEMTAHDSTHPWTREANASFRRVSLSRREHGFFSFWIILSGLIQILKKERPDMVVFSTYGNPVLFVALFFAKIFAGKTVLFSESHAADKKRFALWELVKSFFLKLYDCLLAAGKRSRDYAIQLGYPENRVCEVGDVVDNAYFSQTAAKMRSQKEEWIRRLLLSCDYFLYVGRFACEKNLPFLLRAYAKYRALFPQPWELVLVGSGPQEQELKQFVRGNGLGGVKFYPFQPLPDLAAFYAFARAFILPSLSEPWGLVVNEAAACSLPLLVSNRAGCIPELIKEGENGFAFDPENENDLAEKMKEFSERISNLGQFGKRSYELVSRLTPETYANRVVRALSVLR